MIDNKTSRLQLPLPNVENYLEDDVARLSDALTTLDGVVATIAEDGKLVQDQVPDYVARLDVDGKLPASVLPSIAINESFSVETEADMLALKAEIGDVAIRNDINKTYILSALPASALSSWKELLTTAVSAVNGRTGNVTVAEAGANRDITSLNALSGPLRLGGDAAGDYDAVTLKQLRAASGGSGGASMNGVMNNFIGAVEWFNGTRAKLPAGYIPADGQEVSQSDPVTADLFAAVSADLFVTATETDWLKSPSGTEAGLLSKRGCYVKSSTTPGCFRVPDLNGMQSNSIQGTFLRGSAAGWTNGPGSVASDTIKDHSHVLYFNVASTRNEVPSAQAYRGGGVIKKLPVSPDNSYDMGVDDYGYAANEKYVAGRTTTTTDNAVVAPVGETAPRAAVGIWIIRANGASQAANTNFSVINADATKPANGTRANSGTVSVEYKVGTAIEAQGKVYTAATIGGKYSTQLSVKNATTGKEKDISVTEDGDLWSDRFKARFGTRMAWAQTGWVSGSFSQDTQSIGNDWSFYSILSGSQQSSSGYKTHTHIGQIHNDLGSFADSCWHVAGDDNNQYGVRLKMQPNTSEIYFYTWSPVSSGTYTIAKNAISDANLKHDIAPVSVDKSWSNLQGLEFVTFVYNNDEQERVRRGVIAQQAETVEPLYVKTREFYDNDHVKRSQKELDTHPMLLDTMHVVQTLMLKIEAMEAEIARLKASK